MNRRDATTLRKAAAYLRQDADVLHECRVCPKSGKVQPRSVQREIERVRKLAAALERIAR